MSPTAGIKSTASNPDLDWSQVRETILMLGLAIGQIEMAMRDSDESVSVLTDSFTSMVAAVRTISEAAQRLPAGEDTRETIENNCAFVSTQMHDAIMAFQFYDRLVQRLDHACRSIDALAELIADARRLYSPSEWVGIQQKIRSKYSMESERIMFDAILDGATVAEALALSRQKLADNKPDDIELF
ncbi:MAG: hypothetical protein AB1710_00675 [Pseudomonadota bacterium]